MSRWQAGIISSDARYRTQTSSQSRGIYNLKEQLQHVKAENWQTIFPGFPNNAGQRIPVTLISVSAGSADNTSPYSVHQEEMDTAAATGSTGRVYLSVKITASTTYHNDFCISQVQLVSDDYSTVDHHWGFHVLSDYTAWEYATVTGLNTTNPGYENYYDIIGATSQSWASNVNGQANGRISRQSATSSSGTGAADGNAKYLGAIPEGTSSISQDPSTYFMYTEATGTAANMANKWFWTRSPEVTLNGESDKDIIIVYHAASPSGTGMTDAADEPLFRWWWVPS